ncbi:MAG: Fasciclin domain, partial [Actinomycetota bacterium]
TTFLALMEEHDPEGFAILADVELADKTVWAPTDAAFDALGGTLDALPSDEMKRILGHHISPPRRSPTGAYDIVTPASLLDEGEVVHRTRTGVLTGSELRIRSRVVAGELRLEGALILPTAWCAEAGSVFAIDAVITEVAVPSLPARVGYRLVRALLYDDVRFVIWPTVGGFVVGGTISLLVRRSGRRPRGTPP